MNAKRREAVWYFTYSSSRAMLADNIIGFTAPLILIGAGAYLDSLILECVGAAFFCLTIHSQIVRRLKKYKAFADPQALADELKRKYGVIGR